MEVELLERPGLLVQSDGVTGVSLFASLNGMAIIGQRYRTINVVCLQRGEMGVSGRINIYRRLVHPALAGLVGLVQFTPVFR